MSEKPRIVYEFGRFRLDEGERRLLRDGEEVVLRENGREERLTPKAFDLLLALVKRGGRMAERGELLEELWPGTFVEDNRLSDNVSTLRKFLGDRAKDPLYIETVPKHGYRFVAEVREARGETKAPAAHTGTRSVAGEEPGPRPADLAESTAVAARGRRAATRLPHAVAPCTRRSPFAAVAAFALLGALAFATFNTLKGKPTPTATQTGRVCSIAVLPFKPLVDSAADPALELGMTDALISKLSHIRQVVVRPTSAVLKYTGAGQDLRVTGSELGVDVLLDGRVQKAGDRVRLSVQLVRASDGATVWADSFDAEFTDILTVQDAVSGRVAAALELELTGVEGRGLAQRHAERVGE
jgi:TolB-like protein/DNA-binding winged helix-turn-helix (wHTH) protein